MANANLSSMYYEEAIAWTKVLDLLLASNLLVFMYKDSSKSLAKVN